MQPLQQDITTLEAHLLHRQRAGQQLTRTLEGEDATTPSTLILEQLQQIEREIADTSQALADVRQELAALTAQKVSLQEFRAALELFDPVWEVLYPIERARILQLLLERVEYSGARGTLGLTFRPSGVTRLAQELEEAPHE